MSDSESYQLTVMRIWAAVAWADGVIVDEEAASMRRVVDTSPNLTPDERRIAHGYLERPVELDTEGMRELDLPVRQGIYQAAARLAAIDSHVHEHEVKFLRKLQSDLAIDDKTARRIEARAKPQA